MKKTFSKLLFSLILLVAFCPAISHQAMASTMEGGTENSQRGCDDSMRREMMDCCINTPSTALYTSAVNSNNNYDGKTQVDTCKSSISLKATQNLSENLSKKSTRLSNINHALVVRRE